MKTMTSTAISILLLGLAVGQIQAQTADSSLNENQKKIYTALSNIRKPSGESLNMQYFKSFPRKEFQHPLVKKRLLELLTPVLNEDEKAAYRSYFSKFDVKYIEIKTKEALAKDSTLSYKNVYDSLEKKILRDLYLRKLKILGYNQRLSALQAGWTCRTMCPLWRRFC